MAGSGPTNTGMRGFLPFRFLRDALGELVIGMKTRVVLARADRAVAGGTEPVDVR